MKHTLQNFFRKDLRLPYFLLLCLAFSLFRILLTEAQQVYLYPDESLLDDLWMYNTAQSIVNGDWLGAYNYLTLAKHSFFSLWLAFLHVLKIPYLLGGQLLWTGACAFTTWAFVPVVRRRIWQLLLFLALLFNPAAVANPAPFAYITRVYRDNIFPSLCLLCFAGIIGAALRYREPLRRSLGWLILCGVFLAAVWLTREDGIWVLPFLVVGVLVTAVFIVRSELSRKALRCLCLLLPGVVLAAGLAAWSGMNYLYYGRFIISDFSSNEFADAYGALTRVGPEHWNPEYAVPQEVREELYRLSPSFALLEEYLEHPLTKERFGNHRSGGFYWALREAAASQGFYDSPQLAEEYFTQLAAEVNALCDTGAVSAGPERSGVTPPLDVRFVPLVAPEWIANLVFCATFQGCEPQSLVSRGVYETQLAPMEEFLHEKVLYAYQEGTDLPYYSPQQHRFFSILEAIAWLYRLSVPLLLLAAFVWQIASARGTFQKQNLSRAAADQKRLIWLLMLGILCMILLRTAMIAFTSVSSFQIGIYVMYLASVHPLMILYACLGAAFWLPILRRALEKRKTKTKTAS